MTNLSILEKLVADVSTLMAELESRAFQDESFSELSMRQMLYLNTIVRLGHPTFSDLAHELGVTKPSVTAVVRTLIRKGFVKKVQDGEDRRAYHIILTPKANEFNQLHEAVHQRMADILASRLDGEEVEQLDRLMEKALRGK
jgi:DNA-binding MarR family transcriptional regulator